MQYTICYFFFFFGSILVLNSQYTIKLHFSGFQIFSQSPLLKHERHDNNTPPANKTLFAFAMKKKQTPVLVAQAPLFLIFLIFVHNFITVQSLLRSYLRTRKIRHFKTNLWNKKQKIYMNATTCVIQRYVCTRWKQKW